MYVAPCTAQGSQVVHFILSSEHFKYQYCDRDPAEGKCGRPLSGFRACRICWTSHNTRRLCRSRPDIKHVAPACYRKPNLADISSANVFVGGRLTSALSTRQFQHAADQPGTAGRPAAEPNHNTVHQRGTDSATGTARCSPTPSQVH